MITIWIVIQTIIDFLILIAVFLYIIERKNKKKEELGDELRKNELKVLTKSLDRLITESERASINISDKALQSQSRIKALLGQIEKKQEEMQKEVKNAEEVLDKIKNQLETTSNKKNPFQSNKNKYSEAAKLAKTGLNVEEISKQLDLPKGEVELILDLPLRNPKKN